MTVLIIIAIIIAIPFIIALFTKKEYSVHREITINRPRAIVFDYIKYLKNQDGFSVWGAMDPNMKKTYTGTDGTVGFISAWESNHKKVGTGQQEIKKISDGERIDFELRFIKPFAGLANAYMTTASASPGQTTVAWGFDSKMKYPMNLFLLIMNMDKMIGKDFDAGLNNLKRILEK